MLEKHLEKMNNLLETARKESNSAGDSVSLISSHVSRPRMNSTKSSQSNSSPICPKKKKLPPNYRQLLDCLFDARCIDLSLSRHNNEEPFKEGFISKNKAQIEEE